MQIFRAVYQLVLQTVHNPFISLPPDFKARPAPTLLPPGEKGPSGPANTEDEIGDGTRLTNPNVPGSRMFASGPEEIKGDWLKGSSKFERGVERIGELLNGGRAW